ncbi:efflux RND transporter periplasmic adaptor subunit [Noviherbaspirillum sp.]|uniref:efflux RND transporter periplasmic adaptor subunit n=1 Tax=Noviherbaspirillum sp. TaxID=1926288 RepID=UPI002D383A5F|nr:HlyD family efflux transporter periplasmic adaptor subunit [Noviherbaspirillum sp.]HZW21128.1 HlyD family efflux transporter periplasmic adaptor subunit [Noviherbaspirillum sp.]
MDAAVQPGSGGVITLLDLAHQARHVEDAVELDFMAVNATHALAPYRQAALWFAHRKVCALSGVVQIEANAPYVQWLERICAGLGEAGRIDAATVDAALGEEWADWLPAYGLWLPLSSASREAEGTRGGLLLARDIPWLDDEIALLTEWADVLQHAYDAKRPPHGWNIESLGTAVRRAFAARQESAAPWWKRRRTIVSALILLVLLFPVRLTVLAPGELVPANPAVIRSPLDGVIEQFHVMPNARVQKDQPLFDFDEAQLASRRAVAEQALVTAEAEYRQALQQALSDGKSKNLLSTLQGKIEERRAETEFLRGQVDRARVTAPRDGIALFDDPSEWIGRPVATGERIMRIAAPDDVEVEAWLAVGDAIQLDAGAEAELFLSAAPLSPVSAQVRYVSYEPVQRPDGNYAYRVRAALPEKTGQRVGLRGTAKLSGARVPLVYWVLRRPLATIRQFLGW